LLFEVTHSTRFRYSRPVFLEPLTIRLRPRCDPAQRLLRFELSVSPSPAGSSEVADLEGNAATQVWFEGLTDALGIRTRFTAETLRTNPFDYIVLDPEALRVPMTYPEEERALLGRYLAHSHDEAVEAFAREVLDVSAGSAQVFLVEAVSRIAGSFRQEVRENGDPLPPAVTLEQRRGACRDLTVLFMELCRSAGIAARYVSGYLEGDSPEGSRHLHAWADVYLRGVGWRGYDPSQGVAVADRHLAVAAGATPGAAAPTEGTFRGSGVISTLDTDIEVAAAGQP
jgi:transglutaminase-like putative cysteine protease